MSLNDNPNLAKLYPNFSGELKKTEVDRNNFNLSIKERQKTNKDLFQDEETSPESKQFSKIILEKYSPNDIIKVISSLKNIKVLVIGDVILDKYVYCECMEKSAKDALLAHKFINAEIHAGGSLAIANHLAGFSDNVILLSCTGNNYRDLINKSINKKIQKVLYNQKEDKTLIKTRFIDSYKGTKNFLFYNTDELNLNEENEKNILEFLNNNLDKLDLIIISDFGHGMVSEKLRNYLTDSKKFISLNCQLNAGNLGYNFITNYKRANFVSINDRELRLPFQSKRGDLETPIKKLSEHLKLDKINVTLGKRGSIYYNKGIFYNTPAFIKKPIDTIGSGDAVFALGSLLAFRDVDPHLTSFLTNSMGALATKIVGNRNPVNPDQLIRFVLKLLNGE